MSDEPTIPPSKRNALAALLRNRATYGGINAREPFPSEQDFFNRSGVQAYAAPDNSVVLSGDLTDQKIRGALEMNEASRVWMRNNPLKPNFSLTPQQQQFLGGTSYANAPQESLQTIAARLLSGDPSAGQPTPEQEAFVKRLRYSMGIKP